MDLSSARVIACWFYRVALSRWCLFVCLAGLGGDFASAQLRIVSYNSGGGPRAGSSTILQAIGAENVGGIAKPLDAILLQEQGGVAGDTQAFVNLLNALYPNPGGAPIYARSTIDAASSGAGRPTLIYNTQTLQLISESTTGVVGGSANARQGMRYQLRPVGYDAAADLWIYNNHYKASDTSADADRRWREAQSVRTNADALGDGAHIIYAGDFNIYRSSEKMWSSPGISPPSLTDPGNGQGFDPLNRVGNWHDNNSFRDVHTQSPTTSSRYGGQVTGGMDDRFDWQLVSGELLDGEGVSYIAGSYHALGNNGSHPLNGNIDDPSNTALPGLANRTAVLTALASSSDHLPVVVDYQLPAVLQVVVTPVPSAVLVGSTASVQFAVSNAANVLTVNSADELDYSASGSGAVSGGVAGIDQALGGGNQHQLALTTAVAGPQSGQLSVTSSSQAAANPNFSQSVAYDVFDHANGSFSALADVNSLTLDLGIVAQGSPSLTESLALHNLTATAGFTAQLDLDSLSGIGDTTQLSTDLAAFTGLAAGHSHGFLVELDTTAVGQFAANYTLNLSDQDLLGAQTSALTLNLL
ncbi:MAG: hypothetical protein JNG90_13590, partial [Planctomycetaceae bacterium]|nr:hypothetical protein [Planctomycetaceae bacterium]